MAGRIKLLKGGVPVSSADVPAIEYEYDVPGEFDSGCGTFGLDPFVLPHPECLSRFVCTDGTAESSAALFASCIDAMNCAMMVGMTTGYESNDPSALFIHQMVPHHQNAVNMAKVSKLTLHYLLMNSKRLILESTISNFIFLAGFAK